MQAKSNLAKEYMYQFESSNAFVCMLPDTEQNKLKKDGGKLIKNTTRGYSYFVHVPKISNRSKSGMKTLNLDHTEPGNKHMERTFCCIKKVHKAELRGNHTSMVMIMTYL